MNAETRTRTAGTRIAIIYNLIPDCPGYGGFMERGLKRLCVVDHFLPGDELPGYDEYWYIDDGPTAYMEPKHRPATYFAIDMVVQPFWYLQPVETYFQRIQNFDHACVTSTATLRYCAQRGYPARFIGFAADEQMHRPLDFSKDRDWIAAWHNCGDRVAAIEAAYQRYPGGQVIWAGNDLYAAYISRGKCALNWLRGDIVNMRVFEVMAIGTPLITTRHIDMDYYRFLEGQHYLGYSGVDEMLDQIGWVLEHPFEAGQMALRARQFVLEHHTYYHRAMEVLDGNR